MPALITLVSMTALLVFAYWQVFSDVAVEWSQPQYSHGWIIPLIALFILWTRRPNALLSDSDAQVVFGKAKPALGGFALMAAIGYFGADALPISVASLLSGVGLAGVCLVGLFAGLIGQPYRSPLGGEARLTLGPVSLWVLIGVTAVIAIPDAATLIAPYQLPILRPGWYQILAIGALAIGGWVVAALSDDDENFGLSAIAFPVVLVVLSVIAWLFGTTVYMRPLERVSFLAAMVGVVAMVGGMRLVRWAGPAVGFSVFMFPLPTIVEQAILLPLQTIAVRGSEILFTVLGCTVIRQGSRLEVEGIPMEIIEACSGLSMSTILVAMAVAMAMTMKRPWWDKLIVLISALPIAVLSNIFRIVATGLIWMAMDALWPMPPEEAAQFRDRMHDFAGMVLMMPFALGLYWLEFRLLGMLTIEEEGLETRGAAVLGSGGGAPVVR